MNMSHNSLPLLFLILYSPFICIPDNALGSPSIQVAVTLSNNRPYKLHRILSILAQTLNLQLDSFLGLFETLELLK